jgi:raffinose/stachyose/melibiose transport system substrate-binding protein
MKKFLSLTLTVGALVIAVGLGSCKSKSPNQGENSVVVWHWLTDREPALLELANRYKLATGVDVHFQLFAPADNYVQKIRVGSQTNGLPDIYGILGKPEDLANFIEAGFVEKLTSHLGDGKGSWKDRLFKEALTTAAFIEGNPFKVAPGYYGIPIDVSTIPMIYNKKLFANAGLDPAKPPRTWDEFLEAGKKLKASGVTGFTGGWAENWMIFSLATDLAHNLMGAQKVMDTFEGKVPYTDPDWVTVFTAFQRMQEAKFADPSLVTLQNKNAEQAFATERAGMTFNGSWSVNIYAGMNPDLDYAPFQVPVLNSKNPGVCWGGAGTVFYVNAKSPNKEKAIAFLDWLTQAEQAAYLVKETKNLPSVKSLDNVIPPTLAEFAKLTENSIHPNRFTASEDPRVQEVLTKGIQTILIGEKSGAQVAADVQAAKLKITGK